MPSKSKIAYPLCPVCEQSTVTSVLDSRPKKWNGHAVVRRRRQCEDCGTRFSTYEVPDIILSDPAAEIGVYEQMIDLLRTLRDDAKREHRHRLLTGQASRSTGKSTSQVGRL